MTERWLGVAVTSKEVKLVDAIVDGDKPIVIQADNNWMLQSGERSMAYWMMHQRISSYARDHEITRAIVKSSAVNRAGTSGGHLDGAELRGVVACALASVVTDTSFLSKVRVSKTFGTRKVDEYVKDGAFWTKETKGTLRAGSREAAMMILASR